MLKSRDIHPWNTERNRDPPGATNQGHKHHRNISHVKVCVIFHAIT